MVGTVEEGQKDFVIGAFKSGLSGGVKKVSELCSHEILGEAPNSD